MVIDVVLQRINEMGINPIKLAHESGIPMNTLIKFLQREQTLKCDEFLKIVKVLNLTPKDFY